MKYSPILAFAAIIAAFLAWGGPRQPLRDRVISSRDVQVVRGEVPPAFTAIAIPACWECNDFSGAMKAKETAQRKGTPYVLVLCGAKPNTDPSAFGPSWPNIVIVPKGAMMPLRAWKVTVKEDGSWVVKF